MPTLDEVRAAIDEVRRMRGWIWLFVDDLGIAIQLGAGDPRDDAVPFDVRMTLTLGRRHVLAILGPDGLHDPNHDRGLS